MDMKDVVGQEIAARIRDGECIGVGTGTTVDAALLRIGERVKAEGLSVYCVPSSYQSAWRCQELGLHVLSSTYRGTLAWGFDGADQVDRNKRAIKGRGGALLQEKILAYRCASFVVIADTSKVVEQLGVGCPVPVEVVPEAVSIVERGLAQLGATACSLRSGNGKHGPIITERGNLIIDATFPKIAETLEAEINTIVGVVENGLFTRCITEVIIAGEGAGGAFLSSIG
jgi:ribose 5-phosphate isomerase A